MSKSNRINELRARLRCLFPTLQRIAYRVAGEVSLVKRRLLRRIAVASQANRRAPSRALFSCFGQLHVEALMVIDEERAIRVDHLAQILRIPVSEARGVICLLSELGLVEARSYLVWEPQPWVWLRAAGRRVLESDAACAGAPSVGRLPHFQALAAVHASLVEDGSPRGPLDRWWRLTLARIAGRLADRAGYRLVAKPGGGILEKSGTRWVTRRALMKEYPQRHFAHVPDALVAGEGVSIAIKVLLVPVEPRRLASMLVELGRFGDEVHCYCTPALHHRVLELVVEARLPNVRVSEVPASGLESPLSAR